MHLGVDLDNTLICYDEVFLWGAHHLKLLPEGWHGNRKQIRSHLRKQPNGELVWQRLQGQVYGKWMHRASLFSGVYRFLWRCRENKIRVGIVSHKSIFGHYDEEKIPLHETARNFLVQVGIFTETPDSMISSLEFAPSQETKLQLIADRKFDWFIDDLLSILQANDFPNHTIPVCFDPDGNADSCAIERVGSWPELEHQLLGQWREEELKAVARKIGNPKIISVRLISGGGNTSIGRAEFADGTKAALKIYANDSHHDRLYSEYESLTKLHQSGITQIPKPICFSTELNIATYQWVDGRPLEEPTRKDLGQALSFLRQINDARNSRYWSGFPNASAAVFSGYQLEQQFNERLSRLHQHTQQSDEIKSFLIKDLVPKAGRIIEWCQQYWPDGQSYGGILPKKDRILSPSDFGFHNALREPDGSIIFLDLEYFGWDDPAKLIGDFILHPAMNLPNELKSDWIEGTRILFGSETIDRAKVMWPMLGLCWCVILLNVYRSDIWARRTHAQGEIDSKREKIQDRQLQRSRKLLIELNEQYQEFPY